MKLIVIEYCIEAHFETLGFFFYLNKIYHDNDDVDIIFYFWEKCFDQTWVSFFRDTIAPNAVFKSLENILETNIEADTIYVNTIEAMDQRYSVNAILERMHNTPRCVVQKHISKKIELPFECEFVSLFPIEDGTRLLPLYNLGIERNTTLSDNIKIAVVGNPSRTRRDYLQKIFKHVDIIHFYRAIDKRHMRHRIPGITYSTDIGTDEMISKLHNDIDYIFVDYKCEDRMSGIILHAIALGIPIIIRRSYLDKLDIPHNICITFDTHTDLLKILHDQNNYDSMVNNIVAYRTDLISEAVEYYL